MPTGTLPRDLTAGEMSNFVFFILDRSKADYEKPQDVITPRSPLWKILESKSRMKSKPPGQGLRTNFHVDNPDHYTILSQSDQDKERDFVRHDTKTVAKFDMVQMETHLMLGKFDVDNCTGMNALADMVKDGKETMDKSARSRLNGYLWNGLTSGAEHVFGINEFVRWDTPVASKVHTNPASGNIGGLDATAALPLTFWWNWAIDYNLPYLAVASAYENAKMTAGAASMEQMWTNLTTLDGDADGSYPDLIVCNNVFKMQYADLVDRRLTFSNGGSTPQKNFDLGIQDPLYYKGAIIFEDPNVGDAPTAGEGKCIFLNTDSFEWCWAEGLTERWQENRIDTRTGYYWTRTTQFGVRVIDRRKNGIFLGTQAISIT